MTLNGRRRSCRAYVHSRMPRSAKQCRTRCDGRPRGDSPAHATDDVLAGKRARAESRRRHPRCACNSPQNLRFSATGLVAGGGLGWCVESQQRAGELLRPFNISCGHRTAVRALRAARLRRIRFGPRCRARPVSSAGPRGEAVRGLHFGAAHIASRAAPWLRATNFTTSTTLEGCS
jgi:hypothetical protein